MWTELLQTHGYWVLALGCLLEGETLLILAGYAAHRGLMDPMAVLAIAATAGFVGDQLFFWIGRHRGPAVLARWPRLAEHSARMGPLLHRWHEALIVGLRFAYGLRIAGPVLMGTMPISAWRFALFNALGAVLWACVIGGIGWVFGAAAEAWLGQLRHLEGWIVAGLVVAIASYAFWRSRR